jgi:proline iminopeptidase
VLAHDGPGLSNNLDPVATMIDDIACVHVYDQRGGGRSPSQGPFDIETFVADLEALRRHRGHERWIVGGHSWGAALALFYALAHPEKSIGVIYMSGTAPVWGFRERSHVERMRRLTPAERDELEELLRQNLVMPEAQARFLRLIWSTDFASREAAAVMDEKPLYEFPRVDAVTDPAGRACPWLEEPTALRAEIRDFLLTLDD